MYRWCSYCQSFIGQKEPFKDYSLTHGICSTCKDSEETLDKKAQSMEHLNRFYEELRSTLTHGSRPHPKILNQRALQLNIKPSDLLIGIMQPLLYEIGERYLSGELEVHEEHEFSAYIDRLISDILDDFELIHPEGDAIDVLLFATNGEYHEFGVKFLEVLLKQNNIRTKSILPGLPMENIFDLSLRKRPKVICISVTLPENLEALASSLQLFNKWPDQSPPTIFLGGQGVAPNRPLTVPFAKAVTSTHQDFLDLIKTQIYFRK